MKNFLFYFLIALLPLGVIARLNILPQLAVSIVDIVVLCILAINLRVIYLFFKKTNIYVVCIIALFFLGLVGAIIHVTSFFEFLVSFSYSLRFFSYILLFIPMLYLPHKSIVIIKNELLISGFVFILLGYIQYFYYPSLRNLYYLGWDEHLYRLFSTLLDPNYAGVYILLIFYLFLSSYTLYKKNLYIKNILLLLSGSVYVLGAFFLTYSRSSYVAFIISAFVFVFMLGKKRFLLILFLIFVIGILLVPKNIGGEGVNLIRTSSIFSRVDAMNNGLYVFTTSPVIGVGFNTLRFTNLKLGLISKTDSTFSHASNGIPNSYIFILATMGILGFIIFLVLGFYLISNIVRKMKNGKEYKYAGSAILASISAILIQSFFENSLFYTPFMLWVVITCGIFFNKNKSIKK